MIAAITSTASANLGPGRLVSALPSIAHDSMPRAHDHASVANSARASRSARSTSKPHGANSSNSGVAARTCSTVMRTECAPGSEIASIPPGATNDVRRPMSRREERIEPLDHRDARPADARALERLVHAKQPVADRFHERGRFLRAANRLADARDVGPHTIERGAGERHDVRRGRQNLRDVANVALAHRAHFAEGLRENHRRREAHDVVRVEREHGSPLPTTGARRC